MTSSGLPPIMTSAGNSLWNGSAEIIRRLPVRNFEDDPTLSDLLSNDQLDRLNRCLSALCAEPVPLRARRPAADAVPVEFNLETVGWLSGGEHDAARQAAADVVGLEVRFVAKSRLTT